MRRENWSRPNLTVDEKMRFRFDQISTCQLRANAINRDELTPETLNAYRFIITCIKDGVDICSGEFIRDNANVISWAAPILELGMNQGYLDKLFNKLKVAATVKGSSSFSITDIEFSEDRTIDVDEIPIISLLSQVDDGKQILNSWTHVHAVAIFLHTIGSSKFPLLPRYRRDYSAITGQLFDLVNTEGGAKMVAPTNLHGISIEYQYSSGTSEFPKLIANVATLR